MKTLKIMNLCLKDVYQMLISECRYAYTRNNHLMPDGAYGKVKRIIPEMYKVDSEYALYTLKQICSECISDEIMLLLEKNDEFDNLNLSLIFVQWCLDYVHQFDQKWLPYDYNIYKEAFDKFIVVKK